MPSLEKAQRRLLEKKVLEARRAAEAGARLALDQLGIAAPRARDDLAPTQAELHRRLRARGRQLGDQRESPSGLQATERLAEAVAYEHWHRLLFARFLAETRLLLDPSTGVALSLVELRQRARTAATDWLALAAAYAQPMLISVFRPGDAILELELPPETRQALDAVLAALPAPVFLADDCLGWVYQFWQRERKDAVNRSEVKIGANEIAPVTQLFTDDYIVLFLLHNTLGAWWTAKRRAQGLDPQLPGIAWDFLRLADDGAPAAGDFPGWPAAARDLRLLDPCMGSGHFLVFALPVLARMRVAEEGLSLEAALAAVLTDNLFGLEIDERCSQIAAFNLALAAWRLAGRQFPLPPLNLACCGLHINTPLTDWLQLAGGDHSLEHSLTRLHHLFAQAPLLGSLIDPRRFDPSAPVPLLGDPFEQVRPLLEAALAREAADCEQQEMAVAARGLLAACQFLAAEYTLVATNVPYLGRGKQSEPLRQFCADKFPDAKSDLATACLDRCLTLCAPAGSLAVVAPQSWLFLKTYRALRQRLLTTAQWDLLARLGPHAFETVTGEVTSVALVALTRSAPAATHTFPAWDASAPRTPAEKSLALQRQAATTIPQARQLKNPDQVILLTPTPTTETVGQFARSFQGLSPGDLPRFGRMFWETGFGATWAPWLDSPERTSSFSGRTRSIRVDAELDCAVAEGGAYIRGVEAVHARGVAVGQMRGLPATIFTGSHFTTNCAVLIPRANSDLLALWAFASSSDFASAVRLVDQKLNVTNAAFERVAFDAKHWREAAAEQYPDGLPAPHTSDPTQWLLNGHPRASDAPLQVAVARLLGYRWPRQTGSSFPDCPALDPDGLEPLAAADGIACLSPLAHQEAAADRLRRLLQAAYGPEWSHSLLKSLLPDGLSLDDWLRDQFFAEHCKLFHERPFVWHIWDGLRDGFHALINYHRLCAPSGDARRTLERLAYVYLGEWTARQEADAASGVSGASVRLVAARHLRTELDKILAGEPPYDIFVRWKPIEQQPSGWEPDVNDGVRLNLRPWMAAQTYAASKSGARNACILRVPPKLKYGIDRGQEPPRDPVQFPWYAKNPGKRDNDVHLTPAVKSAARQRAQKAGT